MFCANNILDNENYSDADSLQQLRLFLECVYYGGHFINILCFSKNFNSVDNIDAHF